MNLLEHYIEEVLEIEDITNKYLEIFDIVKEPLYRIKMIVSCYGNKEIVEVMWSKSQYETNINKGYYLA
jgi:hypothetical protein